MARPEKVAVVSEVRERLQAANAAVLTEYRGLTVSQLASLRAELRRNDAEYAVVKNTLTRIAAREAGLDVPDALLTGPTAVTFCAGDPVGVAKVLRTFSRANPALIVKGGILEGKVLDAGETMRLADLESREELLARLAGMFQAVVAQPARLAQANLAKAARLFAALQTKREEAGETVTEAPPAAAAASSDETSEPGEAASPGGAAEASEAPTPAPAAESPSHQSGSSTEDAAETEPTTTET